MQDQTTNFDEWLLDQRLGRIEPAQQPRLDALLAADPELRTRAARLDRVLKLLDAWTAPAAPDALVPRILSSITASGVRPIRPAAPDVVGGEERSGRRPFLTLNELLAMAACITFLVGISVPSMARSRDLARRAQCRDQQRSIYGGVSRYATQYAGMLPNLGTQPGEFFIKGPDASQPARPNSRHLTLLLRGRFLVDPRVFQCPSDRNAQPWPAVDWNKVDRFPTRPSYDMQSIAGSALPLDRGRPLPLVSDANPLFMDDRFNDKLTPSQANSLTHHGQGQNVLSTDGSSRWQTSPTIGIQGDNIWQSGPRTHYRGNEVPASPTDSFIIP